MASAASAAAALPPLPPFPESIMVVSATQVRLTPDPKVAHAAPAGCWIPAEIADSVRGIAMVVGTMTHVATLTLRQHMSDKRCWVVEHGSMGQISTPAALLHTVHIGFAAEAFPRMHDIAALRGRMRLLNSTEVAQMHRDEAKFNIHTTRMLASLFEDSTAPLAAWVARAAPEHFAVCVASGATAPTVPPLLADCTLTLGPCGGGSGGDDTTTVALATWMFASSLASGTVTAILGDAKAQTSHFVRTPDTTLLPQDRMVVTAPAWLAEACGPATRVPVTPTLRIVSGMLQAKGANGGAPVIVVGAITLVVRLPPTAAELLARARGSFTLPKDILERAWMRSRLQHPKVRWTFAHQTDRVVGVVAAAAAAAAAATGAGRG